VRDWISRAFLLVVAGLKFSKLFGTVGTMLLSIGVYALAFGWRYAVGIVAMLFIHEMGHYIAARQRGLDVGMPTFVPFVGAWVELKDRPHDAETEAYIGLGGPMLGTVGAIAAWFVARDGGPHWLLAVAYTGFFINLINMIPMPPLDGGRITAVLSPRVWLLGVPILGWLLWAHFSMILLLVAIFAAPHVFAALDFGKRDAQAQHYYDVSPRVRWEYGLIYVGLIAFLAYMTNDLDRELHGIGRPASEQPSSGEV
jgi:Zn-dependent protease